ncbi:hypothetical protein K466DRAFT_185344 [Polyporus arcularius HHB13444]|uniref:Uncharacterized protein n=1 Tax=Polyporus arcularius HHB13444 TaxID=1314778 RepID=A0A5C3P9F1_9APHY|nr:hypothetical protein K466DRAFT_185344 [Polyporus arcularius HHB13444]
MDRPRADSEGSISYPSAHIVTTRRHSQKVHRHPEDSTSHLVSVISYTIAHADHGLSSHPPTCTLSFPTIHRGIYDLNLASQSQTESTLQRRSCRTTPHMSLNSSRLLCAPFAFVPSFWIPRNVLCFLWIGDISHSPLRHTVCRVYTLTGPLRASHGTCTMPNRSSSSTLSITSVGYRYSHRPLYRSLWQNLGDHCATLHKPPILGHARSSLEPSAQSP